MEYKEAYQKLEQYGQLSLLRYYEELGQAEQRALLDQIAQTDFSILEKGREAGKDRKSVV